MEKFLAEQLEGCSTMCSKKACGKVYYRRLLLFLFSDGLGTDTIYFTLFQIKLKYFLQKIIYNLSIAIQK